MNLNLYPKINLLALLALISFVGCGPKVALNPKSEGHMVSSIAALPILAKESGAAEQAKLNYIQEAIAGQLRSHGVTVIEDSVVNSVCAGIPACPAKEKLANDYGVDGFLTVSVESIRRANFLAGYFNTITGDLTIQDRSGAELVSISHTEQERGGLLFNSGQIVQGVLSTIENSGDVSFNRLADKYAASLVEALPKQLFKGSELSSGEVEISALNAKAIRPAVYEICARGSENSSASLLVGKRRTNLREVSPGKYCGIYGLESFSSSKAEVELRSAYGLSTRKTLTLDVAENCLPDGALSLVRKGMLNRIEVNCLEIADRTIGGNSCSNVPRCEADKLLVYKAPSKVGPFRKVAEITRQGWTDISTNKGSAVHYQVVSVGKNGGFSLPYPLSQKN